MLSISKRVVTEIHVSVFGVRWLEPHKDGIGRLWKCHRCKERIGDERYAKVWIVGSGEDTIMTLCQNCGQLADNVKVSP